MKKEIVYTDEPMELGRDVDILPSPEEMAAMIRTERATLTLTKATLDFFREKAAQENVSYTALIRNTLDAYTLEHMKKTAP